MAPVSGSPMEQVEQYIKDNKVMVFSKSTCPFCAKIKQLFDSLSIKYHAIELDQMGEFTFLLKRKVWDKGGTGFYSNHSAMYFYVWTRIFLTEEFQLWNESFEICPENYFLIFEWPATESRTYNYHMF